MDPAITLDTILKGAEILSILGGGGMVAFRLGRTATKLQASLELQNMILEQQSAEIVDLKLETKKIAGVLIQLAVYENRMDRLEEDLREMKHGRGFVNPTT